MEIIACEHQNLRHLGLMTLEMFTQSYEDAAMFIFALMQSCEDIELKKQDNGDFLLTVNSELQRYLLELVLAQHVELVYYISTDKVEKKYGQGITKILFQHKLKIRAYHED